MHLARAFSMPRGSQAEQHGVMAREKHYVTMATIHGHKLGAFSIFRDQPTSTIPLYSTIFHYSVVKSP